MNDYNLYEMVKKSNDLNEILIANNELEILYQLSSIRKNVIDWYEFEREASVLEIGAECGTVTGMLCDRVKSVYALEDNNDYFEVNKLRNGNRDNLSLICGRVSDVVGMFDYIVIVGVTSYKYVERICEIRKHLKDNGKIILAIDNKFSARQLSGKNRGTDPFEEANGVSRNRLIDILDDSGFKNIEFYYPIPDFRLPLEIYAEDYLPDKEIIKSNSPSFSKRIDIMDEVVLFNEVCKDGLFREYANSYIVVAS